MPTVAMRVVRSRRKFINAPKVKDAMERYLEKEAGPHFKKELEAKVSNWSSASKPKFTVLTFFGPDEIRVAALPISNIEPYIFVDKGTKGPYDIPSGSAGFLAFQLGYVPKTTPQGGTGGPGKATGEWRAGIMQVSHPGIKAREFEKKVKEDNKKWFNKTAENAWKRAIRRM